LRIHIDTLFLGLCIITKVGRVQVRLQAKLATICLFLCFAFVNQLAFAQVDSDTLGGVFPGSTVLDLTYSPYFVQENITVQVRDTLIILPGVELQFAANAVLMIEGTILAAGAPDNMIRFTKHEDADGTWWGVEVNHTTPDTTQIVHFEFCEFRQANIGLNLHTNANFFSGNVTGTVKRCLFNDCNVGLQTWYPGNYEVHNCTFRDRYVDVQCNYSKTDLRNCLFLPRFSSAKKAIFMLEAGDRLDVTHEYNCFDTSDEDWIEFIHLQDELGHSVLPIRETEFAAMAFLTSDPPWTPDPDISPLVDAGDPTMTDPDGTVIDIGLFWTVGDLTPLAIGELDPSEWVVGYDWRAQVNIAAYPPPVWEELDIPAGLTFYQQGRHLLVFSWDHEFQEVGSYRLRLAGYNTVAEILHYDTLDVTLDFEANQPPVLTSFSPCYEGDCLGGSEIVIDHLPANEFIELQLVVEDPNAARLGSSHHGYIDWELNGVQSDPFNVDTLVLSLLLDTLTLGYQFHFHDGLSESQQLVFLDPRYTLLTGDLEGVLSTSEMGAIYLADAVRVPEGHQLRVEAGTRMLFNNPVPDGWIFEVEGSVAFEGSEENPIEFVSTAPFTRSVDLRPDFMRIHSQAEISGLRHLSFQNLATALQFDYVQDIFPVEDCEFNSCRYGLVAVQSPVQLRRNIFRTPNDSLHLGSAAVYIAESVGNDVRNNLFLNAQVGLQFVNAEALVANNSFQVQPSLVRGTTVWPGSQFVGFGRVQSIASVLDVRNNLFQWKSELSAGLHHIAQDQATFVVLTDDLLDTRQHALWVDELSEVHANYNWYNCVDGVVRRDTTITLDLTLQLAVNDITRLASNGMNRIGPARVDSTMGFILFEDSDLIDSGDLASEWNDVFDGSRNDLGWKGGPFAENVSYSPVSNWQPGDEVEPVLLPSQFKLSPAWPNPFNAQTQIQVEMAHLGRLQLSVYNLLGQEVMVLSDDILEPGRYRFVFDAEHLATGSYFLHARTANQAQTQKILFLK
jgi:hypothetical protein